MSAIRVAVADDQELFVYGLRMLIESQSDLELAGTAHDGAEAVALVDRTRPDVVLMDIRMPALNGIEATLRITAGTDSQVVMLTTFQQEQAVFESLKHGASAFVTKDVAPEVLLDTIRAVHAGDAPQSPVTGQGSLTALVRARAEAPATVTTDARPAPQALAALSPREREIYLLAATGLRNAQIAAATFVSEATVKSHIRSVLAKLGLYSRAQIVVHAYEHRLVS
ncbi:response regulator [Herbiconiux flava]|uniref:DNA-binding NarL/FixJ family response regulator n=1 Tax=Herbiconiux flava TaxID=881268 RepID=A0A852SR51_9MICO|nr:response regulator transcription factor [Herbiconiux flava]NYD71262.1 DNA-binding NarL/FixJ family response regulator [Herbiconiux flava]GLK18774.1 DNA-binding response regulator [Herbiconiux flava]